MSGGCGFASLDTKRVAYNSRNGATHCGPWIFPNEVFVKIHAPFTQKSP
jgi:hypothetical protein